MAAASHHRILPHPGRAVHSSMAAAAFAVLCACGESSPSPQSSADNAAAPAAPWFTEVADEAGLAFHHESGHEERFFLPEIMAGGAALFDMDGDGWLDAYLVQSGSIVASPQQRPGNQLFRNHGSDGPGRFENVTEGSGADDRGYGVAVAVGDYDNNGFPDLYVTNVGPNVLLRNNGDGTFTDVTDEAGVGHDGWSASAGFLDADNDGSLDLFVSNYLRWSIETELTCTGAGGALDYCNPESYNAPAPDVLYRNNGDGTFADVTIDAGMRRAFGNGLGVLTLDYNRDGHVDIFVANDLMPNQLWENQGDGMFRDVAMQRGCAIDQHGEAKAGMGVAAVDMDENGWQDVLVVNLRGQSDSLYRNRGGYFVDDTMAVGLGAVSRRYTRFGMAALDFNNDGLADMYEANGAVYRLSEQQRWSDDVYAEPNVLMRGMPGGRFEIVEHHVDQDLLLVATSRAAAFGDVDNDGFTDILVVNRDHEAHLLRNITHQSHDSGHWIGFRVVDEHGRDAYNATVTLHVRQRRIQREVRSAFSYAAANDPRIVVGLGPETGVTAVTVNWLDGQTQSFGDFEANQFVTLSP